MKYILALILLAIILPIQAQERPGWIRNKIKERWVKKQEALPAPEVKGNLHSMGHAGLNRYYILHIPRSYNPKTSAPLVIALHGGGGNMEIQANDEYYKIISKSEREGFIAVFPNGYSKLASGRFATWNAGKCCGDARDKKSDDVGFIRALVKKLSNEYNIDSKKVFSIGMSNGGMMSYRLACDMPDVIKGIASVAGTDNTIDCRFNTPVSILHIHSRDDDHVLYDGGIGKGLRDKSKVTDFTSVAVTIDRWVHHNKCDPKPTRVLSKWGAYCDKYTKCANNVSVQLCVVETGGHSWPGGKKPRGNQTNSTALSANDVIWDFLKN